MVKLKKPYPCKIQEGIQKHAKRIRSLLEAKKSLEAVSINLIQDLLVDVFGYERDWLIPQENISNKHVDIAIRHPSASIMCEGKKYDAEKNQLNDSAKRQLDLYCRAHVCEWGILTDGIRWEFYWYPLRKTKKERQKIAEADFIDLPHRITTQYCEKFHIFHSKISPQERSKYARNHDLISPENMLVWLRHKECFKALCKVIQTKQNKTLPEINKLIPHIYGCFTQVLPLPIGRNNPYDPIKNKVKRKKSFEKENPQIIDAQKQLNIIKEKISCEK